VAQLFPKWTNHVPTIVAIATVLLSAGVVGFVWYYFPPGTPTSVIARINP
jgi:predicted membrane-bound mannosyltransferase